MHLQAARGKLLCGLSTVHSRRRAWHGQSGRSLLCIERDVFEDAQEGIIRQDIQESIDRREFRRVDTGTATPPAVPIGLR